MTPYRARLYKITFGAAAAYNIAFGLAAGFWPNLFFDSFRLARPNYPAIWSCLGMVVGVYGILYAHAAMRLDAAKPIIVVGFLGKILGPIGWTLTVHAGEWPLKTLPLIVFNDLVWWLPFALFLLEGTKLRERLSAAAPIVCTALHLIAPAAALFFIRAGSEMEPDVKARVAYIDTHHALWGLGWSTWMMAALSLTAFYAWWGSKLASPRWGVAAVVVTAAGNMCDLTGESLLISWLPDSIARVQPLGLMLTACAANGLYTLGGMILTIGTPSLRGWMRLWTWAIWAIAAALSVVAPFGNNYATYGCTTLVMVLFCLWPAVFGRTLK